MKLQLCGIILLAIAVSATSLAPAFCASPLLFGEPPFKFLLDDDVNADGQVNTEDLVTLGQILGATSESVNWNLRADVDRNGIIDIFDVVQVGIALSCAT